MSNDRLETLWELEQIRQLKARYFQAVDEKDYAGIAAMFTPDAIVDFSEEIRYHVGHHGVPLDALDGPPAIIVGGAATAAVIKDAIDSLVTVHHGHDPQIVMNDATTATGRWSMFDILEYPDEVMYGYGHYHERYVNTDGQWQFAALRLSRIRVEWRVKEC